jgi:hypothetical protein
MLDWLARNREWVFSGIGVIAVLALARAAIYLFRHLKLGRAGRRRPRVNSVSLVFLKPIAPYNAGEIAGFDRSRAERYVAAGVARFHRRRDPLYAWWRALVRLGGSQHLQ